MKLQNYSLFLILAMLLAACASSSGSFNSPMLPEGEDYLEFADTMPKLDINSFIVSYPDKQRRNRVEGRALVQFVVDREGRPNNIRILTSSGNESLDLAAKQSIKKARFSPGIHQGELVNVLLVQPVQFRM
ncbi:MAG: energy transducer TonB [Balneolales bacterium]|nr:energy transducer TonB [Balneolales bacterium]